MYVYVCVYVYDVHVNVFVPDINRFSGKYLANYPK